MLPQISDIRYIVFLLDHRCKNGHDGQLFCSAEDARKYAVEMIEENWAQKAVIGYFVWEKDARELYISQVETIGFKGDKKNIRQMDLFNYSKIKTL